jgi:protein involved in polysaccharide export with SLBB domain
LGVRVGGVHMVKYFSLAFVFAVGLLVSGCYTDFGPVELASEPVIRPYVATRLQPGDRIKVTVYGEDNLNGVYDIDPAGNVSLPLAGTLRASGHTKADLQRQITAKYKSDYLQNPKVTVDVVAFRPFYVMGEVEHPGEFAYRSDLNVLSATTLAGGLTYRASRSTVLIKHPGEEIWTEYAMAPTVMIGPGDLIRIPARYF